MSDFYLDKPILNFTLDKEITKASGSRSSWRSCHKQLKTKNVPSFLICSTVCSQINGQRMHLLGKTGKIGKLGFLVSHLIQIQKTRTFYLRPTYHYDF